ncbi:hypothetical protein BDZ91DRAFT_768103 [Kalaharituber pfeilii]|nr:hypothetical protein BDZ91DRAFT_768103 [Kalaharituber pfeilii]
MAKDHSFPRHSSTDSNRAYANAAVRGDKHKRHDEDKSEDRTPVEQRPANCSEGHSCQGGRQRRKGQCNGMESEQEEQAGCEPTSKAGLPFEVGLRQQKQQISKLFQKQRHWLEEGRKVQEEFWNAQKEAIEKLCKRENDQGEHIKYLLHEIETIKSDRDELRQQLAESEGKVAELTDDLVRAWNRRPEPSNDDNYFDKKFLGTFLAVQTWALQYIARSAEEIQADGVQSGVLTTELLHALSRAVRKDDVIPYLQKYNIRVFEAFISTEISHHIFHPDFLGIVGPCYSDLENHLFISSLEEFEQWRSITNTMILRHPQFEKQVDDGLEAFVLHILNLLEPVMKQQTKTIAGRKLREILKHAGNLALECEKQPCKFWTFIPEPLDPFKAEAMSCVDGDIAETELEAEGALVDFVVSPIILRGYKQQHEVITKARVAVTRKSPPCR